LFQTPALLHGTAQRICLINTALSFPFLPKRMLGTPNSLLAVVQMALR